MFRIVESLADGSKGQADLLKSTGLPAQSTLRSHLRRLEAAQVVVSHRLDRFPGTIAYELSPVGRDLLAVVSVVEQWLRQCPGGAIAPGSDPARAAIKGLAEGWTSTILAVLSTRARTLTELDKLVDTINYPTIERRLTVMRLSGQIDVVRDGAKGTPYVLTDWARRGVAPLIAAARWEAATQQAGSTRIGFLDIEGAILLAAPLIASPPSSAKGVLRLEAVVTDRPRPNRRDVVLQVDERVSLSAPATHREPDAHVSGSDAAWFSAVVDGETERLEIRGKSRLARSFIERTHKALFPAPHRTGEGEMAATSPG